MKYLIALFMFVLFASNLTAQKNPFIKEYLERLENSRKYTLLVAKKMPKEKYNFKASEGSLSFAQNLLHIGYAMDWHSQSLLGDRKARTWQTDTVFKVANKSKKQMITLIDETFNEAIKLISKFEIKKLDERLDYFGLSRTKRQILMLLADHITHHRGQMLVYLRLNDIVPPRYVLFQ
ncbi:DinB family protein [Polaribacter porphyrae]|uniref:Damage-inducible protein DinB n=1 Tax=Polaribacter porphyrae TaxID=1137780 RepID=A0A2S7WR55_9FLAO|nr:DinB family protein [Polaribacter porphyrae]PQJ80098.1 damage-inducible protein DinB [Polaribacter porphyrae]